ncbi:hypothetical protein BJ138DRAFT_1118972 [Hygrophoropsis aurantiaca]|uniref:Uncharacterized protein n=1 Tax=Hygrophoropsis aurantiaca TaxID=72124 RepID=A0ACB7ZUL2_9AGAM|nr:hypothetical protein BJ138DRAFT_1118972 [Hygrophoropsis aurantiaca]
MHSLAVSGASGMSSDSSKGFAPSTPPTSTAGSGHGFVEVSQAHPNHLPLHCLWYAKIWLMVKSLNQIPVWYALEKKYRICEYLPPFIKNSAPEDRAVMKAKAFYKKPTPAPPPLSLNPFAASGSSGADVIPPSAPSSGNTFVPWGVLDLSTQPFGSVNFNSKSTLWGPLGLSRAKQPSTSADFTSDPWWVEYLEKKQKKISESRQTADPQNLQRFNSRLLTSQSNSIPGNKGPVVYHWQTQGSKRVRARIDQNRIEDVWDRTSETNRERMPEQRVFDEVANTWDICTEFDSSEYEDNPGHSDGSDSEFDSFLLHVPLTGSKKPHYRARITPAPAKVALP